MEDNGDLKLDSYTIGGITQEVFGNDDDEYIVRVKKEFKDTILLHLVRERFKRESEFVEWLKRKEIPCEIETWP